MGASAAMPSARPDRWASRQEVQEAHYPDPDAALREVETELPEKATGKKSDKTSSPTQDQGRPLGPDDTPGPEPGLVDGHPPT